MLSVDFFDSACVAWIEFALVELIHFCEFETSMFDSIIRVNYYLLLTG